MVKLKISAVIDVPDGALLEGEYRFGSAVQLVFDEITNYVMVSHLEDAVKWCAKAKDSTESVEYRIFKNHQYWGRLLSNLNWDYEEVVDKPEKGDTIKPCLYTK